MLRLAMFLSLDTRKANLDLLQTGRIYHAHGNIAFNTFILLLFDTCY